jgi:hypothetical protein
MNGQSVSSLSLGVRSLNAIALQNAVLCAECDVVSDSPHDRCLVCGSSSLFNIARMFGGALPKNRVSLVKTRTTTEPQRTELVLAFPKGHRVRRRVSVWPDAVFSVALWIKTY